MSKFYPLLEVCIVSNILKTFSGGQATNTGIRVFIMELANIKKEKGKNWDWQTYEVDMDNLTYLIMQYDCRNW